MYWKGEHFQSENWEGVVNIDNVFRRGFSCHWEVSKTSILRIVLRYSTCWSNKWT